VTRKSLPKEVIEQWPEVFSEVDVKAIPLEYLHSMRITFDDGKVWDVDIAKHAKTADFSTLEEHIAELLAEYEDSIQHIDFRLDVARVKKDIIKKTRSFLKKPKQL
jgi:hypothetical protein